MLGIKYEDLAYATENAFASVGANNGHNGTTGLAFAGNPEIVTDFAWRSYVVPDIFCPSHPLCRIGHISTILTGSDAQVFILVCLLVKC